MRVAIEQLKTQGETPAMIYYGMLHTKAMPGHRGHSFPSGAVLEGCPTHPSSPSHLPHGVWSCGSIIIGVYEKDCTAFCAGVSWTWPKSSCGPFDTYDPSSPCPQKHIWRLIPILKLLVDIPLNIPSAFISKPQLPVHPPPHHTALSRTLQIAPLLRLFKTPLY